MSDISRITRGLRTGIDTDPTHGAIAPPLYSTSTFAFAGLGEKRTYDYTRSGNPTRALLGEAIATLEGGAGCTVTATGTAAMTATIFTLLERGGTVLVPHDSYGGTWRLFDTLHERGYLQMVTVDFTDPAQVEAALARRPELVWIETPSNPLLRITDIDAVTRAAHEVGALVVVDNTFCSPLVQRPFEYDVDVIVHSTTKYINGHSDVVGGAIVSRTPEVAEKIDWWSNVLGVTAGPYDSLQALRGLRTLAVRLEAHERNGAAVADLLASHPAVSAVYYPGLPDHPGHEIAARQQKGFGGMVSCELAGGYAAVEAFVDGLEIFSLAESLGGIESLVDHPATMTHVAMTDEARAAAGVTDSLLRLSVGIDATEDVLLDLRRALDRAAAVSS